jgi:hypothetical protein
MYGTRVRCVIATGVLSLCVCGISCSNSSAPAGGAGGDGDRELSNTRTSYGPTVTEICTTSADDSAVDKPSRSVTLSTPDGKSTTFKAGDEVRNFDQIAVGDKVTTQIWQQLAVYLQNGDPTTRAEVALAAARVPKGAKPGGFMVASTEQTAAVVALDRETRQATLRFADGKWRSFQVGDNVDLANVKVGDQVSIRHTEGAAILVQGK